MYNSDMNSLIDVLERIIEDFETRETEEFIYLMFVNVEDAKRALNKVKEIV